MSEKRKIRKRKRKDAFSAFLPSSILISFRSRSFKVTSIIYERQESKKDACPTDGAQGAGLQIFARTRAHVSTLYRPVDTPASDRSFFPAFSVFFCASSFFFSLTGDIVSVSKESAALSHNRSASTGHKFRNNARNKDELDCDEYRFASPHYDLGHLSLVIIGLLD